MRNTTDISVDEDTDTATFRNTNRCRSCLVLLINFSVTLLINKQCKMVHTYPPPEELRGAVLGTVLYLSLYLIVFIQFQSYTKFYIYYSKYKTKNPKEKVDHEDDKHAATAIATSFRNVKYYNTTDLLALNGDRTVGNFVEQAIVFLPLLWIHAVFVRPESSLFICILYTSIRSIYPLVFYTKYMFLCTIPGYMILFYMIYEIVTKM